MPTRIPPATTSVCVTASDHAAGLRPAVMKALQAASLRAGGFFALGRGECLRMKVSPQMDERQAGAETVRVRSRWATMKRGPPASRMASISPGCGIRQRGAGKLLWPPASACHAGQPRLRSEQGWHAARRKRPDAKGPRSRGQGHTAASSGGWGQSKRRTCLSAFRRHGQCRAAARYCVPSCSA